MTDDEAKFDVRVRQRLLKNGSLKEAEIAKHLEGLMDVTEQAAPVVAKQPALQSESDRDIVIVRTSGVRPPPTAPRFDDDLESTPIEDDLDDDDDDDDDDVKKPAAEKLAAEKLAAEKLAAEKPASEKPAAAKPAPAEESGDDDDEKKDGEEEKKVDEEWGESST